MPARTRPITPLEALGTAIPKIFDQVQTTSANHQKNCVALYKLHSDAASHTEPTQGGRSVRLVGERTFEDIFVGMLARVLPVKKGVTVADRIVKFVGTYARFINEKAAEERQKQDLDEDEDTTASRFIARVLKFLLAGCVAKDKAVRFRVVQCIADMISHLGEIDEDLYTTLRSALLERVRDKEPPIRAQAATALTKLAGSEDPADLEPDEQSILDVLLETLAYDTSPDVRRATLLNTPVAPQTLPALLARTRDVDPGIRRLVYTAVFEPHVLPDPAAGVHNGAEIGPTHPRALTIAQRELIVRNGLGDREEGVRSAAERLVGAWVDVVRIGSAKGEAEDEKKEDDGEDGGSKKEDGARGDVMAFLELFDLAAAEGKIAEDALLSVFRTRPDILDNLEFDDGFWAALTPEKAFLARVFTEHCAAIQDNARLESALPVVTAMAFRIQAAYNALIALVHAEEEAQLLRAGMRDEKAAEDEEEERARREEERMDGESIIGEMLRLAVGLDYADEIGRRRMFQLVRDMISQDVLPESLVARCLDVLRILSPDERDLIRVVVEVVHELRDPSDPEEDSREANDGESEFGQTPTTARTVRALPKPNSEMTPEEKTHADAIDLRCLSLCIGMLERVNGTFEENSTLEGILGELIIPAVKRKELLLRQRGLVSLGLCCLIARRMALNSFQLFLSQIQSAPEVIKISVLQIVFDILMVHEGDFLGPGSANGDRIVEYFLHLLEKEDSDQVQALLCIGISKLMLSGMITDDRVLKSLVLVFISPETATNQELRQCLSYFFPVYCYSSAANQRRMQKVFIPLYEHLISTYMEWDGDEEIVTPAQVGLMFVDWTDPQKAATVTKGLRDNPADDTIHIDLASDIVKALFSKEMEKDDKKALCQLLGKLHIPDILDDDKLRTLKLLTHNLRSRRPLRDTASQNAFVKFDSAISKKFERQLEGFSEEEYRQLENLKGLFEFLDEIESDSEEDEKPKKTRKRRSESVVTVSTASGVSEEIDSVPPSPRRHKGKAKRRRLSQSDDESDDDTRTETGSTPPTSVAPTRVMPRRSAAERSRRAISAAVTPRRDSEDDDDGEEGTLAPSSSRTKESHAEGLDGDIDAPEDEDEEEEEVDQIIG
ncbi:hypothetical protein AcV7_002413 [Taiwanofungus camphoratus]|nr:hypothetical protein AcV7_002413 [Antrodia cinnamomea]